MIIKSNRHVPQRFQVRPLEQSAGELRDWFETDIGRYILAREREAVGQLAPRMQGYRLVQLGIGRANAFSDLFDSLHQFTLGDPADNGVGACSAFEELPLPSETIESVFLHHALEFSQQPTEVIKEAYRVLTPGGQMMIVLFPPSGMLGLARLMGCGLSTQAIWHHHMLRVGRVADWLNLLGMEVVSRRKGGYLLPINRAGWIAKGKSYDAFCQRHQLPGAAFQVIVAKKRVARLINSGRPQWKASLARVSQLNVARAARQAAHQAPLEKAKPSQQDPV